MCTFPPYIGPSQRLVLREILETCRRASFVWSNFRVLDILLRPCTVHTARHRLGKLQVSVGYSTVALGRGATTYSLLLFQCVEGRVCLVVLRDSK